MNDDTPQTTGPVEYYQQHWERLVEMHGTPVCVMYSGKTWSVYGGNLVPTRHRRDRALCGLWSVAFL